MKLKLAKQHSDDETSTLSLKDIEAMLKEKESVILYFDQENAHKDLVALVEKFEEKDYSVYLKEVKYGLDENDYIYEVHIL
jgi:cell fate regulator YaaT (PSP1 superfamily)